jgi:K+-transporting ATPase KdpF subunit
VTVDTLVWIAGIVSAALLVYLLIALLLPEKLQ